MAALIVAVGAAACMSMAGPALAATSHSLPAPNVRAELRTAIAAQLNYNPAGRVIDADQISYDHGAMIVTLSVRGLHVSPDFTCPAGDFCFFTKIDLKGNGYAADPALYSKQTYYSIHTWYPSANLGSVHNRWSERVFISRNNPPGSGPNLCYPPTGTGSPNEDLNWVYFATSAC
jgi:hypothetical protein